MWRDRKKLLRVVMAFLVGCAILGFIMGVKGALPRGSHAPQDQGPPAAPTEGVVIEAAPIVEPAAEPAPAEEKPEPAKAEPEEKEKPAEPEKKAAEPKPAPAPAPAPKEEAPPADPVGDLLETPQPPPAGAVIY